MAWLAAIVCAVGVGALGVMQSSPKPPDPRVAREASELEGALSVARVTQQRLKNPPSFAIASAAIAEDGTVCLTYRATNSFGGVVTERVVNPGGGQVLLDARSDGFARLWAERCSQGARDVTRMVKRFL